MNEIFIVCVKNVDETWVEMAFTEKLKAEEFVKLLQPLKGYNGYEIYIDQVTLS